MAEIQRDSIKREIIEAHILSSSKGNQFKLHEGNLWYKADFLGYEGASECLCAKILASTNLDFVDYDVIDFSYHGKAYRGCVSENFLPGNARIVTLHRLHKMLKNIDVSEAIRGLSLSDQMRYVVEFTEQGTGLKEFGKYLTALLEFDAFVLNEDRHFNNIAILAYNNGDFDYCPVFDNGAAFLSDTITDYPIDKPINQLILDVSAKPFSYDFKEQANIAESLYGQQLTFDKSIYQNASIALQEIEKSYGAVIYNRIFSLFCKQVNEYKHLYKSHVCYDRMKGRDDEYERD